jgi:hypothetical protein
MCKITHERLKKVCNALTLPAIDIMVHILMSCTADVFRKSDFFYAHALNTIRILPQLIDVERKRDTLDLMTKNRLSLTSRQMISGELTSIRQKLGTISSPSATHPVGIAPVALPGFTKNLSIYSYASNLCVPPQHRTSTSSLLASARSRSASVGATTVKPSMNPIRNEPWVTTWDSGRDVASESKRPLTILRSGDMLRRYS